MHIRDNIVYIILAFLLTSLIGSPRTSAKSNDTVRSTHFKLSAFGVESTGFPTIDAKIDFLHKSSNCQVTYYEPDIKPKSYSYSKAEIDTLAHLMNDINWQLFKKEFSVSKSDQPTSTLTISVNNETFKIRDYGLEGDDPLPSIYRIVYKLDQNFR